MTLKYFSIPAPAPTDYSKKFKDVLKPACLMTQRAFCCPRPAQDLTLRYLSSRVSVGLASADSAPKDFQNRMRWIDGLPASPISSMT